MKHLKYAAKNNLLPQRGEGCPFLWAFHFGSASRFCASRYRPRQRRGATLLIVVACIVLAGLAMVGVTRQSLRMATDSVQAEIELQQRWATTSLQRTMLHSAPRIFADLEQRSLAAGNIGPFPSSVQTELLLGGVRLNAVLADEQAKLNLNAVYHSRGVSATELAAQKMKGFSGLRTRLSPEVPSTARGRRIGDSRETTEDESSEDEIDAPPPTPAFRHWGQVFDLSLIHI